MKAHLYVGSSGRQSL